MKRKKAMDVTTYAKWSREWYESATPDELLNALVGVDKDAESTSPMDQL